MKIVILVNDISKELPHYTTTHLALCATRRGHDVWYTDVESFVLAPDGRLHARAARVPDTKRGSVEWLLRSLAAVKVRSEIDIEPHDILLLRNNPADDEAPRPWAQTAGMTFGDVAKERGVTVLNDPAGLARAMNKVYLQYLPEHVRPATLIARDRETIRRFVRNYGAAVLKPVSGSGGRSVFVMKHCEEPNFNTMVDAVLEHGYIVAQEYLPAAAEGDIRLFLLNGRPLEINGRYAAIHRKTMGADPRNNMSVGAKARRAKIDARILEIAELVRPRLVEDGMFLVGLDIAGGKIMEVNVFSPGGLGSASLLEQVDFSKPIVDALESKHGAVERCEHIIDNRMVATL